MVEIPVVFMNVEKGREVESGDPKRIEAMKIEQSITSSGAENLSGKEILAKLRY